MNHQEPNPMSKTDRPGAPGEFEARLAGARSTPVRVRVSAGHVRIDGAAGTPSRDVHVDDVAEVMRDGSRIEIALLRQPPLVLECDRAEQLDAAVVTACCTIPELTRALRSLGSSRLRAGGTAQREFFAPLLDARRRAEESVGRAGVVRAFDPERLHRALDGYLSQLTERRADARPAARRAFAAQAAEAAEPLRAAIDVVRDRAATAANPPADARVATWRSWSGALHDLFSAADQCWAWLQSTVVNHPDTAG
jgi:ribosomal 50S subunit-recycling heat shock protein